MKLNTKKALSLFVVLSVAVIPMVAGAQFNPTIGSAETNLPTRSAYEVLITFMQTALVFLTILAVIAFIISGIMFVTAGGSERSKTAMSWLQYSITGIIVGLIGYIVIRLISNVVYGGPGA